MEGLRTDPTTGNLILEPPVDLIWFNRYTFELKTPAEKAQYLLCLIKAQENWEESEEFGDVANLYGLETRDLKRRVAEEFLLRILVDVIEEQTGAKVEIRPRDKDTWFAPEAFRTIAGYESKNGLRENPDIEKKMHIIAQKYQKMYNENPDKYIDSLRWGIISKNFEYSDNARIWLNLFKDEEKLRYFLFHPGSSVSFSDYG